MLSQRRAEGKAECTQYIKERVKSENPAIIRGEVFPRYYNHLNLYYELTPFIICQNRNERNYEYQWNSEF